MPDILELAREHKAETGVWIDAQDKTWVQFYELADLEAFAQRIREDEREKAAKVCDELHQRQLDTMTEHNYHRIAAAAIRRGGDHG